MEIKFVKKVDQKYDVSRVKNISLCGCKECDFINCPNDNYDYELTRYIYPVEAFISYNCDALCKCGFSEGLVDEYFESCVDYPSDYYYSVDDMDSRKVYIVRLIKTGESKKACFTIDRDKVNFVNKGLSKEGYKWCLSILRDIEKILKEVRCDD